MMKIYRDGVYFAQGENLQDIAGIAGEDVSRYSYDLDELKARKRLEIRRAAFAEQDTHLAPGYEDRDYIHIILAALQNKPDPRQNALLNIKTKLDEKIAQINAATTEAAVELVTW